MNNFIEKCLIGLIIFFTVVGVIIFLLNSTKPSCEELGGKEVEIGNNTVLINNFPHKMPEYKCVFGRGKND